MGFSGFLSGQVDPVGITYQWGSQTRRPLYGDFHRLVEEETSVLEDITSHMCGCPCCEFRDRSLATKQLEKTS